MLKSNALKIQKGRRNKNKRAGTLIQQVKLGNALKRPLHSVHSQYHNA